MLRQTNYGNLYQAEIILGQMKKKF